FAFWTGGKAMETALPAQPLRRLAQVLVGSVLAASTAFAAGNRPQVSPDGVWRAMGSTLRTRTPLRVPVAVRKYRLFPADRERRLLRAARARLSDRLGGGAATTQAPSGAAPTVLTLPMPDGSYTRITVREDSILGPDLQAGYPDIRTYSGEGLDDPTMTAVLD